ncbi:localization factor PodJL [Rhizobium sp. SG_E_25_P2]|uniref:peptidoglycan-binding protein n=1 Tax=Rhizobium sp. SG_E_25_P2 TaxID=2879942 RepID=UPI00247526D5|nr:peptidoglycan-binding protein [Rhizobium sp. SG_E_25_P2]MDH6265675.1 localization factor PodJL [Rhizobium sp. SG_E_25_P2]
MNGSRSQYSSYGGKPSFDQLSKTIEGLEARIQGLVGERRPPSRPAYMDPGSVDEILERQRMLSSVRERVAAADRTLRADAERSRAEPRERPMRRDRDDADMRREPPRARDIAPQPPAYAQHPQTHDALAEIAATLEALRAELRQGLSHNSLDSIREEIRGLKGAAAGGVGASDLVRKEILKLNETIRRLGETEQAPRVDDLLSEIEDLRTMATGLAREDSFRRLDDKWSRAEQIWDHTARKVDELDQDSLREELVQIAWRIDGIKSGLGEINAAPAIRSLEDKLITLADAVESVGRSVEAKSDLGGQFEGLDRRLDEITRAIAASVRQADNGKDHAALQSIEKRIGDLGRHIDALHRQNEESGLAQRIELLTNRIEELAGDEETQKLELRIAELSGLIERSLEDRDDSGLAGHLADLSRKIDRLGDNDSAPLINRLDHLARRLDDLDRPVEPTTFVAPDFSHLENRLSDIAARLEETASAAPSDTRALANLEQQIASLSSLLSQPAPTQAAPEELTRSMAVIEDYIATSDEFIVEAARQAAEAVVEAYARAGSHAQGAAGVDLSTFAALTEDLRALETYARSSEERTAETFSALHQTLTQIARRLDDIGLATERSRREEAPVMPRAPEAHVQMAPRQEDAPAPRPAAPAAQPAVPPQQRPAPRAAATVDVYEDEDFAEAAAASVSQDAQALDPVDEPRVEQAKARPTSLIASLAAKLRPSKKTDAGRMPVDPPPALDSSDDGEPDDGMLIEPGGTAPDVRKIMEKVRAGQKSGRASEAGAGPADVIAAARRAAQAAAREAGMQQPLKSGKATAKPSAKGAAKQADGQARRPLLLAAGAVLLLMLSYPLVSNLINNKSEPPQAVSAPAEDKTSGDIESAVQPTIAENSAPAQAEMAPVETADAANSAPPPAMPEVDAGGEDTLAAAEPTATELTAPTPVAESAAPVTAQAQQAAEIETPADLKPASLAAAAKKADPLAFFEIGARFADGRGLAADPKAAITWYQRAADAGFAPAQYRLASIYEKGLGVDRDIAKARTLYAEAAAQGNTSAMHNLAVLNATGAEGKPDFAEAARWFKEAAEHNVRDSQYNLAILYARGNGVPQDLTQSYKWFAVAAMQGDQDAAQKRDEVANALGAEKLKAAKAEVDLWRAAPVNEDANNPVVPDDWVAKANTTASVDMKKVIRNIQAILNNNGFDAGPADGAIGKKTVEAIKAFQKKVGQEPTGKIDEALVKELLKHNKKPS